ncbi:putative ribonuclease H-like domain-containing protein [Tanacetum coccineum]
MQEELLQFKLQKVWTLVDLPKGKRAIGTKWVYRNKKDERGIVVRNKARLVAQGYTQEEGIDYDEVFAPVARIEAIRLFLAYASFMGLIVYQMDVKSAFLYGTIEEEVYVCQPPGFEDPQFPDKVYKVEKALYGLHQAPRAWYETLSTYLLENGYRRGTIDKTLFIKKERGDILLVHVYVDDIIFGSTKKSLCVEFEQMMHKRFQMSSMGELTFFLGLQAASTPIETNKALNKDKEAEDVNDHLYRSMIRSLMYLTASRPDIMFVVYACARFQVTPKTSHLHAVKRIFRYLKGQSKLGLWYPRDSPFDLEAFSIQTIVANSTTEAEYVATANCCGQMRLSIRSRETEWKGLLLLLLAKKELVQVVVPGAKIPYWGGAEAQSRFEAASKQSNDLPFSKVNTLGSREDSMKLMELMEHCTTLSELIRYALTVNHTIYTSCIEQFWAAAKVKTVNGERQLQALVDKKNVIITETSIRSDLKLEDAGGTDCLPTTTIFEELARMGKDSAPTKPTAEETPDEAHVSTPSYDPSQSGEDRMQLHELKNLCTKLSDRVLALETTKSNQALEIESLKRRVKSLEKRKKSRTSGFKRLRKVGSASRVESSNDASLGAQEDASKHMRKIADLDADAEVTLEKGVAEKEVSVADPVTTAGEVVTTANLVLKVTNVKYAPQQQLSEFKTTSSLQASQLLQAKDKGKGLMVEPEVPLKKKDQVALDEEMARNLEAQLQAELIKEERLARQKEEEANIALLESRVNT